MNKLLMEAFFTGLILVIFGTIVSFIVGKVFVTDLPPVCKDWNKNYVMEISLFFTGFIAHLSFEYIGLNKWYCNNGHACNSK